MYSKRMGLVAKKLRGSFLEPHLGIILKKHYPVMLYTSAFTF